MLLRSILMAAAMLPLAYLHAGACEIDDVECLDAQVDLNATYKPVFSNLRWVVSPDNVPAGVKDFASNNNVGIAFHDNRLFMAWRTGPKHFASKKVRMYIVSSADWGKTWRLDATIFKRTDLREPMFTKIGGKLFFTFFEAGSDIFKFEPKHQWRTERLADGSWTKPAIWGLPKEITWDIRVRGNRAWRASYTGDHYHGDSGLRLYFTKSSDGVNWEPVEGDGAVYSGGVSEASFEFDLEGNLWGVTRNEDGDDTGFGAHVVFASKNSLGKWEFPKKADPERYDSPRLFRHGKEIYMIARRDVGGPFDKGWRFLPRSWRKFMLWKDYWFRAKRTALYRIDQKRKIVLWLQDLPSAGDTAFPSIIRVAPNRFLLANYTSPLRYPGRDWFWGQVSPTGTQIYFMDLEFK